MESEREKDKESICVRVNKERKRVFEQKNEIKMWRGPELICMCS